MNRIETDRLVLKVGDERITIYELNRILLDDVSCHEILYWEMEAWLQIFYQYQLSL